MVLRHGARPSVSRWSPDERCLCSSWSGSNRGRVRVAYTGIAAPGQRCGCATPGGAHPGCVTPELNKADPAPRCECDGCRRRHTLSGTDVSSARGSARPHSSRSIPAEPPLLAHEPHPAPPTVLATHLTPSVRPPCRSTSPRHARNGTPGTPVTPKLTTRDKLANRDVARQNNCDCVTRRC